MIEQLTNLSFITALAAIVVWIGVFLAYWPLVKETNGWLRAMFCATIIVACGVVLRSAWWDITQAILPRERWLEVRDALGGQEVSAFFNVIFGVAGCYALYARVMMMSEKDQKGLHWWTVWMTFWRRK